MTNTNMGITGAEALFITFKNAVAQKLVVRGFLSELPSDIENEPAVQAAVSGWYAEGNNPQGIVDNIAEAIISVCKWIDAWEGYQEDDLRIGAVTVSLAFAVASGAATFTLDGYLGEGVPATPANVSRLQVRLYDMLKQSYDLTAKRRSAAGVLPNGSPTDKGTGLPEVGGGEKEEIVIVEKIYVAVEKGKMVVKLKGGQYMAHGVNCYIEVYEDALKKIGKTIDDFKHGYDAPIRGKMGVIQGDRAKKVSRVTFLKD